MFTALFMSCWSFGKMPRMPSPDPPTMRCTPNGRTTINYLRRLPGMKKAKRHSNKCYSLDLEALQHDQPNIMWVSASNSFYDMLSHVTATLPPSAMLEWSFVRSKTGYRSKGYVIANKNPGTKVTNIFCKD